MKIGILTFHRATNYGAVLQCYGLYETLKIMGHEVEVIDYRPICIERYRQIIPWFTIEQRKGLINKAKMLVSSVLNWKTVKETNTRFDSFLHKHFVLSPIVKTPQQIPQNYDVIIVGSDQVWSPQICFGFDSVYWGQFPHADTRLLTYAASIGGHNQLTPSEWMNVADYLKAFEKISVRELQLKNNLNDLGVKSDVVVDPTILVDKSVFERIAIKPPSAPNKYILVFSVAPTENLEGFASKIADQIQGEIVYVSAYSYGKKGKQIVTPTVEEFLGWFKYASCVVTVSFHGTVFSVLFKKDFYSLRNYMQDRAEHFLFSIGLGDRLVQSDEQTINSLEYRAVNYVGVDERIDNLRSNSRYYLQQIFQDYK